MSSPLGALGDASLLEYEPRLISAKFRVMGHYCLMLLLEGSGSFCSAGQTPVPLKPGDAVLTCPRTASRYGPDRGHSWTELYMVFDGPVFDSLVAAGLVNPLFPIRHLTPVEEWHQRFRATIPGHLPRSWEEHAVQVMRFAAFLTEVLAVETQPHRARQTPSWLARARFSLEHSLQDDLNMQKLAEGAGVSYETFRKRITRELGLPPATYRLQRRIAVARELLTTTDMTGKEIGVATGLGNEFEFSRRFKQETGMSPRAFRAGARR